MAKDVAVLPEHERNVPSFPVHTLSKSGGGIDGYITPRPAPAKVVAKGPFDRRASAIRKTKTASKTTRVCITMTTRNGTTSCSASPSGTRARETPVHVQTSSQLRRHPHDIVYRRCNPNAIRSTSSYFIVMYLDVFASVVPDKTVPLPIVPYGGHVLPDPS